MVETILTFNRWFNIEIVWSSTFDDGGNGDSDIVCGICPNEEFDVRRSKLSREIASKLC